MVLIVKCDEEVQEFYSEFMEDSNEDIYELQAHGSAVLKLMNNLLKGVPFELSFTPVDLEEVMIGFNWTKTGTFRLQETTDICKKVLKQLYLELALLSNE